MSRRDNGSRQICKELAMKTNKLDLTELKHTFDFLKSINKKALIEMSEKDFEKLDAFKKLSISGLEGKLITKLIVTLAHQCSFEEFSAFFNENEMPGIRLTNDEMQMLSGGAMKDKFFAVGAMGNFALTKVFNTLDNIVAGQDAYEVSKNTRLGSRYKSSVYSEKLRLEKNAKEREDKLWNEAVGLWKKK